LAEDDVKLYRSLLDSCSSHSNSFTAAARHFHPPSPLPCPLSYSSSRSRWVEQGRRLPKLWTSATGRRPRDSSNAESTTDFPNEYSRRICDFR